MRVAAAENPTHVYGSLTTDTEGAIHTPSTGASRTASSAYGGAQRGGILLVPRLLPHVTEPLKPPVQAMLPKLVHTVVIAGGMGGLGLLTACWLTREGAAKLVLLGRSGRASDSPELVSLMGSGSDPSDNGGASRGACTELLLVRCNVTSPEEVAAALRGCNADLVCHAGGILQVMIEYFFLRVSGFHVITIPLHT